MRVLIVIGWSLMCVSGGALMMYLRTPDIENAGCTQVFQVRRPAVDVMDAACTFPGAILVTMTDPLVCVSSVSAPGRLFWGREPE